MWEVEDQVIHIETDTGHRSIGGFHDVAIAPAIGVIIERVGNRYQWAEGLLNGRLLSIVQFREKDLTLDCRIRDDAGFATGTTH